MKRLLLAFWLWLAMAGLACAHEISFSRLDLRLDPAATHIDLRLSIKALMQEDPTSLPAGAGESALRQTPLPASVQAALSGLAVRRLHLSASGAPLPFEVSSIQTSGDEVAIEAEARAASGEITVEANPFPTDPLHKLFVSVYRGPELAGQYALDRQDDRFTLQATHRPLTAVIATFVAEGVHHIFIGPDHILFVLALVLLGGSLWSQVKIVTGFTAAHSLTLALAALHVVDLPSRLTESTIALSIVVVGLHDLWRLRRGDRPAGRDPRVLLAFGFGLIHGFGFASVMGELELPTGAVAWSLAAFNIGVEIGQASIVLLAAPILLAIRRHAPPQVARRLLMSSAGAITLTGGFWFVQRALGL